MKRTPQYSWRLIGLCLAAWLLFLAAPALAQEVYTLQPEEVSPAVPAGAMQIVVPFLSSGAAEGNEQLVLRVNPATALEIVSSTINSNPASHRPQGDGGGYAWDDLPITDGRHTLVVIVDAAPGIDSAAPTFLFIDGDGEVIGDPLALSAASLAALAQTVPAPPEIAQETPAATGTANATPGTPPADATGTISGVAPGPATPDATTTTSAGTGTAAASTPEAGIAQTSTAVALNASGTTSAGTAIAATTTAKETIAVAQTVTAAAASAATVTAAPTSAPTATPPPAPGGDGGLPGWLVPVLLTALFVIAALAVGLLFLRRRTAAGRAVAPAGHAATRPLPVGAEQMTGVLMPVYLQLEGDAPQSFPISDTPFAIGRDPANHLVIDETFAQWQTVSREHAIISRHPQGYVIEDRGSQNGVRVNGRLTPKNLLRNGWQVSIGGVSFRFVDETQFN